MANSDEKKNQIDYRLFWLTFVVVMAAFGWFFFDSMRLLHTNLGMIHAADEYQSLLLLKNTNELNDAEARLSFLAKARLALEHDAMFIRQRRTNAALANRTWLRFMSLIFGTVLVVIGALFVLGRVTAPPANASVQWDSLRLSLASSSPGIVLALLGCLLIGLPNLAKQRIAVRDHPAYMIWAEDNASTRPLSAKPPGLTEAERRQIISPSR